MLTKLIKELESLKSPEKAKMLQRFFKTGKGEYGEGDVFWGITVPQQREVARRFYKEINLQEIKKLLHSKIHEHRLTALLMLVAKYKGADRYRNLSLQKTILSSCHSGEPRVATRGESRNLCKSIFDLYLKNTKWINNWDLVDLSSLLIIGEYLFNNAARYPEERERRRIPSNTVLEKLAISKNLWERRIAIISTFTFIRQNEFSPTLKIAEILLRDKHDLIHKAVGWMLREVGKRDKKTLVEFLNKYHKEMPRVMLRYAIEKFPKEKRLRYLNY